MELQRTSLGFYCEQCKRHSLFRSRKRLHDLRVAGYKSGFLVSALSAVPGTSVRYRQSALTAAQAPYTGNAQLQQLALAALLNTNGACYAQNGGVLTPTRIRNGRQRARASSRRSKLLKRGFLGSQALEVERALHRPVPGGILQYLQPYRFRRSGHQSDGGFRHVWRGTSTSTPDSANAVLGSGGPRHIQFGLKLTFFAATAWYVFKRFEQG